MQVSIRSLLKFISALVIIGWFQYNIAVLTKTINSHGQLLIGIIQNNPKIAKSLGVVFDGAKFNKVNPSISQKPESKNNEQ